MEENYLEHHGIKGMHWGVRRYQNPDGTLTAEGKRRKGQSVFKSFFSKKKDAEKEREDKIKKMSDQELVAAINRIQNEKRYRELTAPKQSEFMSNLKKGFGIGAGKAASNASSKLLEQLGKKIIDDAFGDEKKDKKKDEDNTIIADLIDIDERELTPKQLEAKLKYQELIKQREKEEQENSEQNNNKQSAREAKREAKRVEREARRAARQEGRRVMNNYTQSQASSSQGSENNNSSSSRESSNEDYLDRILRESQAQQDLYAQRRRVYYGY